MTGSLWFRRLVRECKKISPHIRIKAIKHGFYRIYYHRAYIAEIYKEAPLIGYNCTDKDFQFTNQKYVEEFEDQSDLIRKTKNFVEGYFDSVDKIRTRVYMMRHNKEFFDQATKAYGTLVVK